MEGHKQREYYRLEYPNSYHPSLMIDVDGFEILDLSEFGLKVKVNEDLEFRINDNILGIISFPDGKEFDLEGEVVRIEEGCVGLQLLTPLPLRLIRSEHMFIINNYPVNLLKLKDN